MREGRGWERLFTGGTKLRDKYLETGRGMGATKSAWNENCSWWNPGKRAKLWDSGKQRDTQGKGEIMGFWELRDSGILHSPGSSEQGALSRSRGVEEVVGVN